VDPRRGSVGSWLLRLDGHAYGDFVSAPAGAERPGAREISNAVVAEERVVPNERGLSDLFWAWGQFLDHDLDLTGEHQPEEPFDVPIPTGDPWFDPAGSGDRVIHLSRSHYDPATGQRRNDPRRHVNEITAWIDASQVYGSSVHRATALRRNDGSGELLTGRGNLLPFNHMGLDNAGGPDPGLFVAGDVRANENVALTVMHTLWMREHDRQARRIRRADPGLDGDEIYQRARARVGALMQVITYREFLPLLLGEDALPAYEGWAPFVDAGITAEFSTAAYRFGHSMVSSELLRLRRNGSPAAPPLPVERAFFAPHEITPRDGIEPYLRGLVAQRARAVDTMLVDGLRNFLFGPPGAGGFDLASLNIQRGRDQGLASYMDVRTTMGLPPLREFWEITSDGDLAERLEETYPDIRDVDLWVGGLAEDHIEGSLLGPTFRRIITDQFLRLRDGDRFFYRRIFRGSELRRLESTRLADVIRRNTRIRREIPDDVFLAAR
ncbi:MAG: peroxidase family protein, partial [Acidobacteriota bacterium]